MPFKRLMPGPAWSTRAGANSITAEGIARKLRVHDRNKVMTYVTGTPDGAPASVGILRISTDYGESWANATLLAGCDGCLDVVEGPNDELWGLFYDSSAPGAGAGYTAKVGVSTNAGSSWTLKKTHTAGHQAFNLAVSAERGSATRVAFLARNAQGSPGALGTAYELVISTNAGTTWNTKNIGVVSMEDTSDVPLIHFAPGRVIVYMPGDYFPPSGFDLFLSAQGYIIGSDLWVPFGNVNDAFADVMTSSGGGFTMYLGGDFVWGSSDKGVTWSDANTPDGFPDAMGITPDGVGFATKFVLAADELYRTLDGGGTWSLVLTLSADGGFGKPGVMSNNNGYGGIAVHPTDSNRIAVICREDSLADARNFRVFVEVSTDGGSTWTRHTIVDDPIFVGDEKPNDAGIAWHESGSLAVIMDYTLVTDVNFSVRLYVSTNDGASWSLTETHLGGACSNGTSGDGYMYFQSWSVEDARLYTSTDGTSFTIRRPADLPVVDLSSLAGIIHSGGHEYILDASALFTIDGVAASSPSLAYANMGEIVVAT